MEDKSVGLRGAAPKYSEVDLDWKRIGPQFAHPLQIHLHIFPPLRFQNHAFLDFSSIHLSPRDPMDS